MNMKKSIATIFEISAISFKEKYFNNVPIATIKIKTALITLSREILFFDNKFNINVTPLQCRK